MIRILFLLESLSAGGAEKVLRTLVNNMDQQQFQITVQTVESADAIKYLIPGIRYKAINRCKTRLGKKLMSYWIRLCAEIKLLYPLYIREDYDIEVAYLECGPTKFLAGSTNKNALKLAWVHCDFLKRNFQPTMQLQRIYQKYDKIVCVSKTVQNSFHHLFGSSHRTMVMHTVCDEEEILCKSNAFLCNHPHPCNNFVSIGRLSYEKGYDRLLDACYLLKNKNPNFHLQILGEGPERTSLENQIHTLGLEDHISFLGFQENPYPYMKAADCIVCSSRYEGFSTVVTEALILGKPIVTTPCSGMDELLGDSEYGLITGDSMDGIYQGMKAMLENPDLRSRYAEAAAERGKAFSKEAIVAETQQFFVDELSRKQSGK